MTSSSVICEPFNSDTQYSALSSIDLNTTSTITVTSTCDTITPNTSITTTTTFMNDEESSMVHEDNNSPVRCKSLETKLPEKYQTNSSTKKRHRSTLENQWNRSTSLNSLTNLKLHNTKTPVTLSFNGEQRQHEEFDIISKKRKTTENTVIHTDSNDSEQSVYNHELKTFEYGSVYDYPQPKPLNYHHHHHHEKQQKNRQINTNENFGEINSSCEQVENKEAFNDTHHNRIQLKHLSSPSSSSSSVLSLRKNYSNESQINALNDSTNDTCSNNPEDEGENELASASELTTAAYNNFVRRVVDDTLDRTVTFCEQPRHAITALENICRRAWPQLEVKRHRNRIRAYLKACRRNSKKNKGQINMKEPPANGLSIEARQLVSKALLLVADDLDYLKQAMQAERTKNKSIFSTKMDGSREKSYFTGTNNNNNNSNTRSPNHSLKMDLSNPSDFGDVYSQKHDLPTLLENSNNSSNEKLKSNKNLWNTPHNLLSDIMTNSSTSAFPFTDPLLWSNSLLQNTNLDSNYLAAAAAALAAVNPANILKLLPAALQLNNHNNSLNLSSFNSNTNRSNNNNNENSNNLGTNNHHEGKHDRTTHERHPTRKLSHTWCDDEFTNNQHHMSNCSVNNDNNNNDNNNSTSPNLSENKSFSSDSHFSVGLETSKHSSFNNFGGGSYLSDCFNNNDAAYCSPPPAHTSSIQYSPTINQALDRLTDTGLLTHDDVEFFLQNPEVTKAAIKQARCQSYLILKKIEIVENQIKSSLNSSKIMPLNLS